MSDQADADVWFNDRERFLLIFACLVTAAHHKKHDRLREEEDELRRLACKISGAPRRERPTLQALLAQVTDENKHGEVDA